MVDYVIDHYYHFEQSKIDLRNVRIFQLLCLTRITSQFLGKQLKTPQINPHYFLQDVVHLVQRELLANDQLTVNSCQQQALNKAQGIGC